MTQQRADPTAILEVLAAHQARRGSAPAILAPGRDRAGSNALPAAIQRRLESALGIPVIQGYGMTETGHIAQNPLPPRERRIGSVGGIP